MAYDFRYVFMPYCLKKLKDGRYIPLNRDYKPLGISSSEWVVYEEHPSACTIKITPEGAQAMSWNHSPDTDVVFFYNDGCVPTSGDAAMKAYSERIAHLAGLKVGFGNA